MRSYVYPSRDDLVVEKIELPTAIDGNMYKLKWIKMPKIKEKVVKIPISERQKIIVAELRLQKIKIDEEIRKVKSEII